MDNQQAAKLLGLSGDESNVEVSKAYQSKLKSLEEKHESAPTAALKDKFEQMKLSLTQAHDVLIQQAAKATSASPLSQTKLADLPGAGPQTGNDTALEVGTVLAERYEIKAFIAQGGMGAVYRAFDKNRNQDIAIKVMLPGLMQNETARERFLDEARLSSQLSHPNIVNVFDVQQSEGLCFLTMELLEGQDLRELMNNRKLVRQNFSLEEVIEILEPICAGLDHAHELTVHRDIKPENIFLTAEGKYKLMDFGIARVMSTSQRTQTGAASGTAYYMAPEQLKGSKHIDGRADQYALAVLTYELLSGEVPAGAIEPLHQLVKGVSKKVSGSVQQALSPKPENRFENLSAFLGALKGQGSGAALASFDFGKLAISTMILVALLGVGGLISSGGLNGLWDAIKPIDKELVAKQKAEVAKLQGEIKTYKKRLDNGQRNLKSEVRDAERNNDSNLKYLQSWQQLSDDYLFEGSSITELEGKLSMGESLLRQDSQESIKQATTTMTQVRDGYKTLWDEFNAAETLLKAEEAALRAKQTWQQRKGEYDLNDSNYVTQANTSANNAKSNQRAGELVKAKQNWQQAKSDWQSAYSNAEAQVAQIERARANEKERIAAEAAKHIKMVSIPAGSFQMGCVSKGYCWSHEMPVHTVSINAFKMSETEVTFALWDACVAAKGCSHEPVDYFGWGRGSRPVIHVSYNDITQQFIPWLNKVTGNTYRLPTEAEWEYAARAGSSSRYSWGNSINCSQARYGRRTSGECGDSQKGTVTVKSYQPNAFGLYDMHGNVWEWTQDCRNNSYNGAPSHGRAWTSGDCSVRRLRGGSWSADARSVRAAFRGGGGRAARHNDLGFRLAQD
ncbi:SUMF1/EgtB/PvdO family nonheme iron enzyme [Aliikangiella sp. IMCC44653]